MKTWFIYTVWTSAIGSETHKDSMYCHRTGATHPMRCDATGEVCKFVADLRQDCTTSSHSGIILPMIASLRRWGDCKISHWICRFGSWPKHSRADAVSALQPRSRVCSYLGLGFSLTSHINKGTYFLHWPIAQLSSPIRSVYMGMTWKISLECYRNLFLRSCL